jgi:hypothetical protein
MWGGHVIGAKRNPLDVFSTVAIIAGWCSIECKATKKPNANGCYGKYDPEKMGECAPFILGNKEEFLPHDEFEHDCCCY